MERYKSICKESGFNDVSDPYSDEFSAMANEKEELFPPEEDELEIPVEEQPTDVVDYIESRYKSKFGILEEAFDVAKAVDEIVDTEWSKDADKGKAMALLKGLAFSDDPKAKKFISDLDALTSKMDSSKYD